MAMKVHELQHELQQVCGVFGRLKETNLVFEGDQAYTDGKNIVIPAMPSDATITDEKARVMRGYVDHEAGHIRHTDFNLWKETLKAGVSDKLKGTWNTTEDMYLERKVMEEYEGSHKNLSALAKYTHGKEYEFLLENNIDTTEINSKNLETATRAWGRREYGGEEAEKLFSLFPEKIQKWAKHFADRSHRAQNTAQTYNIAIDMLKLLKEDPELESDPPPMETEEGEGKPEPTDEKGAPKDAKEAKAMADAIGEDGAPVETPERGETSGPSKKGKGKGGAVKPEMPDIAEDLFGGSGATFEWQGKSGEKPYIVGSTQNDETYHRSRPARVRNSLHDRMQKASPAEYEQIKGRIGGHVNVMKSRLKRSLAAMEARDWDCGRIDGKIDSKRLVGATLGAENVYKKRSDRLELDTAVHMLVDLSGSMSGSKMEVAAECAIAFAECLEGSPIKYQVSGFSNSGHCGASSYASHCSRTEALQTYVFKSFSESLHAAKGPMACLPNAAGGNNSDRDAIIWAYEQLILQPNKRKVLMVFSDGQPANASQSVGYDHLNYHCAEAIKWVQSKGVEVVGIGIQTSHLKQFYKNYVEIRQLSELSGAMFGKLADALVKGRVRL